MAKAAAIATIFVDAELHLTRFTPEATSLFKIRGGDLGRAIDDFTNLLQYPAFVDELRQTINSGEMLQREIQAANGRVYLVRVLPYAVRAGDRRGAVATFVDITTLRDIDRLQAALDSLPEQVAVLDPDGVISLVNRAWRDFAAAHGDQELRCSGPGVSYLERWEARAELGEAHARVVRDGVRGVLDGRLPSFFISDPGHSLSERGWFAVHVAPIHHPEGGVIVSHLDTSLWLATDSQGLRADGRVA
jgi:two-component system CheB/CheR fusion protein